MSDDIWASKKMSALEPPNGWHPDAEQALRAIGDRRRAQRKRRLGLLWGSLAAAFVFAALIGLTAPRACAQPSGCRPSIWASGKLAAVPAAMPQQAPAAASPSGAAPAGQQFKQSGPKDAPLTIEVYSDYECPSCREFYATEYEPLREYYAGKMRFVHRDYPLVRHQFAKLAARYANAAGLVGQYDAAVKQLFTTQTVWSADGNIDAQLAAVLPPDAMKEIRARVSNAETMDRLAEPDQALAAADGVRMTPSMVVIANGIRHMVAPVLPLPQLEAYIDALMGKTDQ